MQFLTIFIPKMAAEAPEQCIIKRFNRETKTYDPVRIDVGPDHFYTMVEAQMAVHPDYVLAECPLEADTGDVVYVGCKNTNTAHTAVKILQVRPKSVVAVEIRGTLGYTFEDVDYNLLDVGEPDIRPSIRLTWTPCPSRINSGNHMIFRWSENNGCFQYKSQFLVFCSKLPSKLYELKPKTAAK